MIHDKILQKAFFFSNKYVSLSRILTNTKYLYELRYRSMCKSSVKVTLPEHDKIKTIAELRYVSTPMCKILAWS